MFHLGQRFHSAQKFSLRPKVFTRPSGFHFHLRFLLNPKRWLTREIFNEICGSVIGQALPGILFCSTHHQPCYRHTVHPVTPNTPVTKGSTTLNNSGRTRHFYGHLKRVWGGGPKELKVADFIIEFSTGLSTEKARKPRSYASPKLCRPTYWLTDRGKV